MLKKNLIFYTMMIALAIFTGLADIQFLQDAASMASEIFIRIFKCLSTPVIALSIIVTISMNAGNNMNSLWKRTITYTITTTIIAALISMGLYLLIQPANLGAVTSTAASTAMAGKQGYMHYLSEAVPNNMFSPFVENQVMAVLFMSLIIGFAIRQIPDHDAKKAVINFFSGMNSLLFVVIKWVIAILPIGLFGFIAVAINQYKHGVNTTSISQYLAVVVLANLVQGFIILPLWLKSKGISPTNAFKGMLPALSVAFFSKSSTGTLPLTMERAEKSLGVKPAVSRFVLPLCTSLNMNGCAAFIFTTVIFVMQNNGIEVSVLTMFAWVFIATLAAVGNAGVPMGCFFLSASLLSSMNIPIVLLGVILPFYSIIDMVETALNVWSDSCVANVVNTDEDAVQDVELEPVAA